MRQVPTLRTPRSGLKIALVLPALMAMTACDYTGDWLFAGAVDGLESVLHLGEVPISKIEDASDFADAIGYAEVGPTGTPEIGGVTMSFKGTGTDVCIWIDPEAAYWIQSLSPIYGQEGFAYPDDVFDDGDLDIESGLAVFYTGSPGETFGDFEIRYEDSLGNVVPISANECVIPFDDGASGGHSGRGHAEFCTMSNTQEGVDYLVALETFVTPMDDDGLRFGYFLAEGSCDDLQPLAGQAHSECVIPLEFTDEKSGEAWDGESEPWTEYQHATIFEDSFCGTAGGLEATALAEFCEDEAAMFDCAVDDCYCGDPATSAPNPEDF